MRKISLLLVMVAAVAGCVTFQTMNEDPELAALVEGSIVFAAVSAKEMGETDNELLAVKKGLKAADNHLLSYPEFEGLPPYINLVEKRSEDRVPGISASARQWMRVVRTLVDEGVLTLGGSFDG